MSKVRSITLMGLALLMVGSAAFAQEAKADKPKKKDKLLFIGHMQMRASEYTGEKGAKPGNAVEEFQEFNPHFRRLRFGAKYAAQDWGTFLYYRAETSVVSQRNNNNDQEQFANIYAMAWWKPMDMVKITGGHYKVPYTRENTRSSTRLYTLGWAEGVTSSYLFDTGLKAKISPMKPLDVFFNVSTGHAFMKRWGGGMADTNLLGTGARTYTDADSYYSEGKPLFTLRAQYQVMGKKVKNGAEAFAKGMGLNVGAAGMYSDQLSNTGGSIIGGTLDGQFYADGAVFNFGFEYDSIDMETSTYDELGFMAEAGYNLQAMGIMPAVRYEWLQTTTEPDGGDSYDEASSLFGFGLNVFLQGHKNKLSFFYLNKQGESYSTTTEETSTGAENRFTFEWQTKIAEKIN